MMLCMFRWLNCCKLKKVIQYKNWLCLVNLQKSYMLKKLMKTIIMDKKYKMYKKREGILYGLRQPDMEKGADMRTFSAEIFKNCGNFLILEDYAPFLSEENLFLVERFDETFNIWHIYSL